MKNLVTIILLVCAFTTQAQSYKIEKISVEDFKELQYAKDTAASALIEYNIGNTYFEAAGSNYQLVTITKTRIKILKKDGFAYATVKTPLYRDQSTKEILSVSNAYTYNLVNGQIEKTKLSNSGEFVEQIEGKHYLSTFTMPNIKEGSIIEYTTKKISPFFTYIPEWDFQYGIPVKYSEFSLKIPDFLIFYKYIKGSVKVNQSTIGDEYFYRATDIPAMVDEGFVSNIDNFRTSIMHTFSGYRDQSKAMKLVAGTWEDVVKNIYEHKDFGLQLQKADFLKETASPLVEGKANDEEKSEAIFQYIQQNFTSNNKRGIYTTQSLKDTFKTKSGSIADINLLAVAMMKSVNVKAYPVLLSTRANGIAYMPSPDAFDSVIIGVEFANKNILYDASDKMSSKDILPIRNLNWMGRLVRDNGSSKDILIEPLIKSRYGVTANLKIDEQGSMTGTVRKNLNNYEAFVFRSSKKGLSNDKLKADIESKYKVEVEEYTLNNMNSVAENIEEIFKITKEAAYDKIGDKIYLSPMSFFSMKENPFKADSRTYPVDFIYPNDNAYIINYEIPEGYTIDYLPKSKKFSTGSNSVILKTVVNSSDTKIQVKLNLEYTKAFVEAHEYQDIKQVFEEMVKFCDEKIVLKKI